MDEELQEMNPTPPGEAKGKKRRKKEKEPVHRPDFPDPQAEHKKFMMVMFGLFFVILILMLVFNQYMDFAVDGGI